MEMVRKPQSQPIIGRDARTPAQAAGAPVDQPPTDARGDQGNLEIEFEMEIPEEGGEA